MTETSLWNRIVGTVIDLESDQPPEVKPEAKPAVVSTPQPLSQASSVDTALQESLMKIALARKTVFSGLIEAAEKLRTVPGMDDSQRIKAAAAMSGSVTVNAIDQAVAAHLSDIDNERSKFTRELSSAQASRVADAIRAAEAAEAEVQRLTSQIQALAEKSASLRASAQTAEAELNNAASSFAATSASVEQYINTARSSIISALK